MCTAAKHLTYLLRVSCFEDLLLISTGKLKRRRGGGLVCPRMGLTESCLEYHQFLPGSSAWKGKGLCTFLATNDMSTILTCPFTYMNTFHPQNSLSIFLLWESSNVDKSRESNIMNPYVAIALLEQWIHGQSACICMLIHSPKNYFESYPRCNVISSINTSICIF